VSGRVLLRWGFAAEAFDGLELADGLAVAGAVHSLLGGTGESVQEAAQPGLRPEPRRSRAKHAKSAKKTNVDPLFPFAIFASWREA
jgi:hypothetical protein